MTSPSYAPKRIFLGLILGSVVFFSLLIYYLWYLGSNQETTTYRLIFTGIVVSFLVMMAFVFVVLSSMVITIIRSRSFQIPFVQNLMRFTLGHFFPIILQIGKIVQIPKTLIMQSFIEVNNQMVLARNIKSPAANILLLLPHCVQNADCKHKITHDIDNCLRCGLCPVKELIELSEEYGISMRVATGGTLARQIVQDVRPKIIVAVACERDLVSGILDSMPLPVLGVLNVRPNGPCFNTNVVIGDIREAVEIFLQEDSLSEVGEIPA